MSNSLHVLITEHWVGSHPSLNPCDLCPKNSLEYCIKRFSRGKNPAFEFSLAPRHSIYDDWFQRDDIMFREEVAFAKAARMRERFLLAGLLASWLVMYNDIPDESSWIWEWYPDGQDWRQSVKYRSLSAIRKVLFRYSGGVPTAKPLGIFYDIYTTEPSGHYKAQSLTRDIVKEQIGQIAASHAASDQFNTTIYYNTIGQQYVVDSAFMKSLCTEQTHLYCQQIRQQKQNDDDKTLSSLYTFCQQHPNGKAIYMHSNRKFVTFLLEFLQSTCSFALSAHIGFGIYGGNKQNLIIAHP